MYNKRYKKSNKKIYGMCSIIVMLIYTISICYSTLQQQLEINGLVKVRRQENIRVTGVEVDSSTSSVTSNWEENDVKNISAGISLPYNDSSITYKVKVTNFGNVDMGIYNIDGLDDRLTYTIEGYKLKEKIEKSGNKKEFKITIKYKSGSYDENNIDYNILLNFEFRAYYKVTYTGFPSGTDSLPKEVMERDTLTLDLKNYQNGRYKITENNIELSSDKYTYINNELTITTVEGDIEITYKKIPEIELVLRENDKNKNITEDLVGGMYRYQGTNGVNNWICFGTTDQTECTTDDGIDKYMYRIIGVTEDGELALIKETVIKEGSTIKFRWNDKYTTTDCGEDGSLCTWANSKLYNRLNGLCKSDNPNCSGTGTGYGGQTNIFINSSYYDYLNDNTWLDKISNHTWKYGDSEEWEWDSYNGYSAYSIESQFPNSIKAKIGLQYIHDYYYAYPGGKPGSYSTAKNAWMHYSKDGYNTRTSYEWLISRYGVRGTIVSGWLVDSYGPVNRSNNLFYDGGVRPVFYLTPDIILKEGTTGEKDNPYIIANNMDGYVQDLSGNNNYGISYAAEWNEEGVTTSNEQKMGYVDCGLAGYDFNQTMTVIMRVKWNGYTNNDFQCFGGNIVSGSERNGFDFSMYRGANNPYIDIYDSWYKMKTLNFGTIELSKWNTLVAVYDKGNLTIYLNGQKNSAEIAELSTSKLPFYLGGYPDDENLAQSTSDYSLTTFSDFLIYDRALSENEVNDNYINTINKDKVNKKDLLLYYKFSS